MKSPHSSSVVYLVGPLGSSLLPACSGLLGEGFCVLYVHLGVWIWGVGSLLGFQPSGVFSDADLPSVIS